MADFAHSLAKTDLLAPNHYMVSEDENKGAI